MNTFIIRQLLAFAFATFALSYGLLAATAPASACGYSAPGDTYSYSHSQSYGYGSGY